MEKQCSRCGQTKPLTEFHKALLGLHGRTSLCKVCRAEQARLRFESKRDQILEQTRAYRERNAEALREKAKERYRRPQIKVHLKAKQRERRAADPNKMRARFAVSVALRRGQLTKPRACQRCSTTSARRLIAHHHSYEPAHWLDVEFICDRCHMRDHGKERAA